MLPGENEDDPFCSRDQSRPLASFPEEEAGLRLGPGRPPRSAALSPGEAAAASAAASPVPARAEDWEADVDSHDWEECIIGLALSRGLEIPRKHRRRMALGMASVTNSLASLSPFEWRVDRH